MSRRLEQLGISVPVFGMVKDDRHRTRAIAKSGGEISIVDGKGAFNLVTTIQDEVHRFAITYSRSKHRKTAFESTLTQVEGIGPARAGALMRFFKTIKNMKAATVEELCQPEGMNRRAAEAVYEFLHQTPDGT